MVLDDFRQRALPGALLAGAIAALVLGGAWLARQLDLAHWQNDAIALGPVWIGLALLYVVLMALPFVPGIEIGLALMLLLGDAGIVLVYLCTQLALALSFVGGRWLPGPLIARLLRLLGRNRAQSLLGCLEAVRPDARVACLCGHTRRGWRARLLRHRYLTLALALNLPGNAVAGGAGGLGLLAGASRLFSLPRYCLLMAVATSPLPLMLLLWPAP